MLIDATTVVGQVSGVEVPAVTPATYVLGLMIVVALIIGLLAVRFSAEDANLSDQAKAHRTHLIGAKAEQTPGGRSLDAAAIRDGSVDVPAAIRELLSVAGEDDVETDGAAGGSITAARRAIREAWGEQVGSVPALTLLALRRALWVGLTGAVALETAVIIQHLQSEPDYPTLAELYADTAYYVGQGVEGGRGALEAFPYASLLWDLTLAYGILAGQWLYQHWYAVVAVLVVGGVVVTLLTRVAPYDPSPTDRAPLHYRLAFWLGVGTITWTTGTATAGLLDLAGIGRADLAGIGTAGVVLAGACIWSLKPRVQRARTTLRVLPLTDGLLLLVARAIASVVRVTATVALALTLVYLGVAIASGGLGGVLSAWAGATVGIKLLTVVLLGVLVAALAWQLRSARTEIATAIRDAGSRAVVRTVIVQRGIPLATVAVAYVLAWGFGRSIAVAIAAAVLVGVLVRAGIVLLTRLRYRSATRNSDRMPSRIAVRGYVLPDADGREHYYVELGSGSTAVAAPEQDIAVREAARVIHEVARGEDVTPSVATHHADQLLEVGRVNREEVRDAVDEQARKDIMILLRREQQVDRETFDEEVADYPPDVVSRRLAKMAPYVRSRSEYVALDRDIYEELVDDSAGLVSAD